MARDRPGAPRRGAAAGTGETAENWDVVAAALQPSRTVYAVNLRGHGASDWPGEYSIQAMADDVAGLLRQLDDRPVDLVGHSLGGLVACAVASAQPESVRRLVLEDVGVPHPRVAATPERPDGDLPFDWRVVEQVRPEIDDPDPRWAEVVARIPAPVLVIAGGPSSHVSQDGIAELVRACPTDGRWTSTPAIWCTRPARRVHPPPGDVPGRLGFRAGSAARDDRVLRPALLAPAQPAAQAQGDRRSTRGRLLGPRGPMTGAGRRTDAVLVSRVGQVVLDGRDVGDPPAGRDVVPRLPLARELLHARHRRRVGGHPAGTLPRRARFRRGPRS